MYQGLVETHRLTVQTGIAQKNNINDPDGQKITKKNAIRDEIKCLFPWRQIVVRYDQSLLPQDFTSSLQNFPQKNFLTSDLLFL